MGLGGLAALVAAASPAVGHLLAFLVFPLLMLFIVVVRALSALPLAAFSTPAASATVVVIYYALIGKLAFHNLLVRLPTLMTGVRDSIETWRLVPRCFAAGCVAVGVTLPVALSRPPAQPQVSIAGSGGGTVTLIQNRRRQAIVVDGGSLASPLAAMLGRHLPFWQRDVSALFVSELDDAHLGGLSGMTSLYDVGEAFDPGAIFPTAAYAAWRAELRDQNVERLAVTAGRRVEFGDGIAIDVLEPAALSLDNDPAPVAYRLQVGGLSVLVLNREAIAAEPTQLIADGPCLDVLVLPARVDVDSALAVARFLRPRIVVLPQAVKGGSGPTVPQMRAALPDARVWTAAEGSEMTLNAEDGHCPRAQR
jgi:competence protein ComEC